MPEANGVFVKIFRDKEAWKQSEGMLEIAKGKFEAEKEYRKKLASEAGLTEDQAKLNFNHHIDPRLFYPELDCNSPEYIAWRYGVVEKDCHNSTTEEMARADRDIEWPTEVLEEFTLLKKHRIFVYDIFNCSKGNPRSIFRFLYGISGSKRYPVAWWGEKKYYDEIQSKLADLAELKRQKEENSATGKWSVKDRIIAAVAILALIGGIAWGVYKITNINTPGISKVKSLSETNQDNGLYCCHMAPVCNSLFGLPNGTVVKRLSFTCNKNPSINHKYIAVDGKIYAIWVTDEIFDKVKVGDKIPFRRPEY